MNWHNLNWADYTILGILAISVLISLIRGFIREALSLASWIIAFWVALSFYSNLANFLESYIITAKLRSGVAFFILFVGTLFIGALLNHLIASLVEKIGLNGADRLLGILFGFGRGVLLIAIILLGVKITSLPQDEWWKQSQLIPTFEPVEKWLSQYIPKNDLANASAQLGLPTTAKKPKIIVTFNDQTAEEPRKV